MKATICPTVVRFCIINHTPVTRIDTSASVELERVATEASAHQVSTGIWAFSIRSIIAGERARLLVGAGEALDRRHVAEHVADPFGDVVRIDVGGALHDLGLAQDDVHQNAEHDDEDEQDAAEAPVDDQRRRQQHAERDKRGEMLAEERQPHAEHARGALDHDLEQPPGVGVGVEAHRQMQHMVEIGRHLDHPAPMGEAVGIQRDRDAGHDREDAEARPRGEPGADPRPLQRVCRGSSTGSADR